MARVSSGETIVVNGEKMTIKEWKEMVIAKQKVRRGKKRFLKIEKPKKAKKEKKELSAMAEEVEKLIKPMTVLKSLQVYKNHAYRSWGTIASEILSYNGISRPMTSYCVKYGELNDLIDKVQELAKKNETAVYQYVDKIGWKLDDMREDIHSVIKGVNDSGVCERFKKHEAIYGEGRQLGLQTVITKCLNSISELDGVIKTLHKIVDDGADPFSYKI